MLCEHGTKGYLPPPLGETLLIARNMCRCVCVCVRVVFAAGKISLRNLRRVARELEENMSEEELRAMVEEFDADNDGESEYLSIH